MQKQLISFQKRKRAEIHQLSPPDSFCASVHEFISGDSLGEAIIWSKCVRNLILEK